MKTPISETNFPELKLLKRGKVRDVYDLGEYLLMVVSDRISAFDVVMRWSATEFRHSMWSCRIPSLIKESS